MVADMSSPRSEEVLAYGNNYPPTPQPLSEDEAGDGSSWATFADNLPEIPNWRGFEDGCDANAGLLSPEGCQDNGAEDNTSHLPQPQQKRSPECQQWYQGYGDSLKLTIYGELSEKTIEHRLRVLPIACGWMAKGMRDFLGEVPLSAIGSSQTPVARASRTKTNVLCEYTWIETMHESGRAAGSPAIYVPGNTRIWSAPRHLTSMEDVKLPINKSHFYRDENTVRQPTHPFEPAFRALAASNPAATCADVDIVADEPTLTSLFDFVSGRISVSFRLDLCLVGRTCFVTMRHKPGTGNNDERFEQYDGPMDDLAFLQLATHPPTLDRARTHHRLVRYRIGNMVCAVRSKVGLVYDAAPGEEKTTEEEEEAPKMDWAKVAQYHAAAASSQSNAGLYKTTVLTGGEGTKTKRTALAVTRHSSEQQSSLAELMPQLWFSRTDYLLEGVIGTNYDAPRKKQQIPVIKGVQLTRAANFFKSWEEENQVALSKLARLLSDFRRLLIRKGGPLTVVIQPRVHYLVVFAPVLERRPLPEDLVVAFWPAEDEKTAEEILLEEEDKEAQYEDHLRSMAQPGACLRPLPCLDRPPSPAEEESSRDQELDEHMRTAHYLQLPTGADDMVDSVEDSQVSSQGSDESMDQDNQSVDQGWQNGDWARYFGGALVDGYLMGDVIQRAYGRYRMSLREQPQTRGDPGGYVSDDESVDDAQTYNNEDDIMDGETIIVRDDSASDDESLKDASEAEAQDGEPQRPQAVRRQDHPDSLKMDQGDTSVIENEDAAFEEYEEEDETENEDADFEEYEDKDDDDYSD